ncbi:hypothetical protein [Duganella sp. P38]|uniref:hypothetical protein n=1 Tax=Duganella sp. P38 TaxID=3423949 RepID=UPI003D7987C2
MRKSEPLLALLLLPLLAAAQQVAEPVQAARAASALASPPVPASGPVAAPAPAPAPVSAPDPAAAPAPAPTAVPSPAPETAADPGPLVVVNGTRSPDLQPYRYMLSGLDAFDDYHALAPNAAEVRFRLTRRDKAPADALDGLAVRISGEHSDIALPLDAQQRFTLPRNEQAEQENADIVLNKKKRDFSFWPDVRSAGVPDGMRRLGDIRLECRVLVAIGKNHIPFMLRAMINTLTLSTDWCGWQKFKLSVRGDGPIARATLLAGDQRVPLQVSENGRSYSVPVGDKQYADDTLIEVEQM